MCKKLDDDKKIYWDEAYWIIYRIERFILNGGLHS